MAIIMARKNVLSPTSLTNMARNDVVKPVLNDGFGPGEAARLSKKD